MIDQIKKAFIAGFRRSGEGWNGEYYSGTEEKLLADLDEKFAEYCKNEATLDSIMGDYVLVPIATLKHWRELVDLNPQDLAPRMDNYLPAAPKHGGE